MFCKKSLLMKNENNITLIFFIKQRFFFQKKKADVEIPRPMIFCLVKECDIHILRRRKWLLF